MREPETQNAKMKQEQPAPAKGRAAEIAELDAERT
jgi:hypothetical protein